MSKTRHTSSHAAGEPVGTRAFARGDYLAAAVVALVALAVYVTTLPPTVTGEDSGELITAAYSLGIAHPPGYPLWCMLGHLFCWLPLGTVAWRVALMSAVFGAGTAALLCLLVIRLTQNRFAGAVAGLALAFSAEFWSQSVIAEVYSLNALLVMACVLILIVWMQSRTPRLLYVFALVYGLGLCNHHTMHFLGPLFAAFILMVHGRPWLHWRTYALMLLIASATWGLVHLYLPIRSSANPAMDWGNPETWEAFKNVVLRGQYAGSTDAMPRSLDRFGQQTLTFLKLYSNQFTLWLSWLPLAGLYPLWKRGGRIFGLIAGLCVYLALGIIVVVNFDMDPQTVWVNGVFFIPCYIMAAVLIGMAVDGLANMRLKQMSLRTVSMAVCAGVALIPLTAHYYENNKSNYYFAYDYAVNTLNALEKDAIYFPAGDHSIFPLIYMQSVEGMRPDVRFGIKYGYVEPDLLADMPVPQQAYMSPKQFQLMAEAWIVENLNRPCYFVINRPFPTLPGKKLIADGLVCKVIDDDAQPPQIDPFEQYVWHSLNAEDARGDYSALNYLFNIHFGQGIRYFEQGNTEQAREAMRTAASLVVGRKDLLHNVASAMVRHQLYEEAEQYYLMVLAIAPNYRPTLRDLASMLDELRDHAGARTYLERLVARDQAAHGQNHPRVASSINDLGGALLGLSDVAGARACFERALDIDKAALGSMHPNTGRDQFNLALALSSQGDADTAQRLGSQALDVLMKTVPSNHPYAHYAQQHTFIPSSGF